MQIIYIILVLPLFCCNTSLKVDSVSKYDKLEELDQDVISSFINHDYQNIYNLYGPETKRLLTSTEFSNRMKHHFSDLTKTFTPIENFIIKSNASDKQRRLADKNKVFEYYVPSAPQEQYVSFILMKSTEQMMSSVMVLNYKNINKNWYLNNFKFIPYRVNKLYVPEIYKQIQSEIKNKDVLKAAALVDLIYENNLYNKKENNDYKYISSIDLSSFLKKEFTPLLEALNSKLPLSIDTIPSKPKLTIVKSLVIKSGIVLQFQYMTSQHITCNNSNKTPVVSNKLKKEIQQINAQIDRFFNLNRKKFKYISFKAIDEQSYINYQNGKTKDFCHYTDSFESDEYIAP